MAEHSYFFNSIPEDPRVYQATDFANYFKVLTRNGVYKNGNDLEVVANGSTMNTTLKSGSAFIEGYRYDNDSDLELTHGTAEATYDRIDLIVLRLDRNQSSRFIKAFIKQGTPSENPVAPELIDDGFIKEIAIAEVRIIAGQSFISQSNLTDKRGLILDPIIDGAKLDNHIANKVTDADGVHGFVYEEGNWTPIIGSTGTSGTHTYNSRSGRYVRIGNQIIAYFMIDIAARSTGATGAVTIIGLPYTPIPGGRANLTLSRLSNVSIPSNRTFIIGGTATSVNDLTLYGIGDNVPALPLDIQSHIRGGSIIEGKATFLIQG